jgi:ferritin-like protein
MDDNAIDAERIRRAAADVDEQHHEAMRTLHDDLGELHFGTDPVAVASRRQFLKRASVGGAVLAAGAGSISLAALLPAAAQSGTTTDTITEGDTPIVVFAQTAELALVSLYQAAIQTDKLSTLLTEVARTFGLHHGQHATTLGTLADKAATNKANQALLDQYQPQITSATSETAVVQVLYQLEQAAAATYEAALGKLETTFTAGPVSTILPIEGQHAVVWGQALNLPIDQWLPAFQSESDALDAQKYAS